ncbi:hypothetical protein CPC08DRAFT_711012 [Agrocybe pediades]|nr:hypothetical protein CPC08DRAFT_711012 [Agrocybe pediades]
MSASSSSQGSSWAPSSTSPSQKHSKRARKDREHKELIIPRKKYLTRSVHRRRRERQPQVSASLLEEKGLLRPDPKFWFSDDGDVTLVIDNVKFRVHKKKLESAGGMYMLAADLAGEKHDGDIGRLHNTKLTVFRYLLSLIYDEVVLSATLPNGKPWLYWDLVVSLIHICQWQALDPIRLKIIEALEKIFPSKGVPAPFMPIIGGIDDPSRRERFYRTFPIEILNIFAQHDYYHDYIAHLPMIYYHAAQLPVDDIINGVQDGDKILKLTEPRDIAIILKGREELMRARREVSFRWLEERLSRYGPQKASEECEETCQQGGEYCYKFLQKLMGQFRTSGFLDSRPNALEGLNDDAKVLFKEYLCDKCYDDVIADANEGIEESWDSLPGYFGLEPWKMIIDKQSKALTFEDAHREPTPEPDYLLYHRLMG